jgi:replicative DNA helicase
MTNERTPPHDSDAERAVIGAIVAFGAEALDSLGGFTAGHFFDLCPRETWEAIDAIKHRADKGRQDLVLNDIVIADELRARGMQGRFQPTPHEWLISCASVAPILEALPSHARVLRDKATLRKLLELAIEIQAMAYGNQHASEVLDRARTAVADLEVDQQDAGPVRVGDVLGEALATIEGRCRNEDDHAVRTRIATLDRILGGMKPDQMIVVAARPGIGKTSLAGNVSLAQSLAGDPVLIFSLEMSLQEIIERELGLQAKISVNRIGSGRLEFSEWRKIQTAAGDIHKAPLYIDDRVQTIESIAATARKWHAKQVRGNGKRLASIWIDYAQIADIEESSGGKNREQEVAHISRTVKKLAKQLHCPVVLLSQLNRAVEARGGRPMLKDLRESGAIEQDADVVIFLHRDLPEGDMSAKNKPGPMELIVGKHRNGGVGIADVNWTPDWMGITAASEPGQEPLPHWTDDEGSDLE